MVANLLEVQLLVGLGIEQGLRTSGEVRVLSGLGGVRKRRWSDGEADSRPA